MATAPEKLTFRDNMLTRLDAGIKRVIGAPVPAPVQGLITLVKSNMIGLKEEIVTAGYDLDDNDIKTLLDDIWEKQIRAFLKPPILLFEQEVPIEAFVQRNKSKEACQALQMELSGCLKRQAHDFLSLLHSCTLPPSEEAEQKQMWFQEKRDEVELVVAHLSLFEHCKTRLWHTEQIAWLSLQITAPGPTLTAASSSSHMFFPPPKVEPVCVSDNPHNFTQQDMNTVMLRLARGYYGLARLLAGTSVADKVTEFRNVEELRVYCDRNSEYTRARARPATPSFQN